MARVGACLLGLAMVLVLAGTLLTLGYIVDAFMVYLRLAQMAAGCSWAE